jgi:hypothetical protein
MGPRVHAGRFTADLEGDFVVFLIGMRINKPWRVWEWWPVFVAMPLMLRELDATPTVLQYWRSYDDLEAYANDPDRRHRPAWQRFFKKIGLNGNVGIWHETYRVQAGEYEAIYANMPTTGLAAAGGHRGLGSSSTSRERIAG